MPKFMEKYLPVTSVSVNNHDAGFYPIYDGYAYIWSDNANKWVKLGKNRKEIAKADGNPAESVGDAKTEMFVIYGSKTSDVEGIKFEFNENYDWDDILPNGDWSYDINSASYIIANKSGVSGYEIPLSAYTKHYVEFIYPSDAVYDVIYQVGSGKWESYKEKILVSDNDIVSISFNSPYKSYRLFWDKVNDWAELKKWYDNDRIWKDLDCSRDYKIYATGEYVVRGASAEGKLYGGISSNQRCVDDTIKIAAQKLVPVVLRNFDDDVYDDSNGYYIRIVNHRKKILSDYPLVISANASGSNDYTVYAGVGDEITIEKKGEPDVNIVDVASSDVKQATINRRDASSISCISSFVYFTPVTGGEIVFTTELNKNNLAKVSFESIDDDENAITVYNQEDAKVIPYINSDVFYPESDYYKTLKVKNGKFEFYVGKNYKGVDYNISINGSSNPYISDNGTVFVSNNGVGDVWTVSTNDINIEDDIKINVTPIVNYTPVHVAYNDAAFKISAKYINNNRVAEADDAGSVKIDKTTYTTKVFNVLEDENIIVKLEPKNDYAKFDTTVKMYEKNEGWPKTDTPSETITVGETEAVISAVADKEKLYVIGENLTSHVDLYEGTAIITDADGNETNKLQDITSGVDTLNLDYGTAYIINTRVDNKKSQTVSGYKLMHGTEQLSGLSVTGNTQLKIAKISDKYAGETLTLTYKYKYDKESEVEYTYNIKVADKITGFEATELANGVINQPSSTTKTYKFTAVPATAGLGGITIDKLSGDSDIKANWDSFKKEWTVTTPSKKQSDTKSATYVVKKDGKKIGEFRLVVKTPVVPAPELKVTDANVRYINFDVIIPDSLDKSVSTNSYYYKVWYKKATEYSYTKHVSGNVIRDDDTDMFSEVLSNGISVSENGLELKTEYVLQAELIMVAADGTEIASAKSKEVKTGTRAEKVEYNLTLKKIQTKFKAKSGKEPALEAIAKVIYNDDVTNKNEENIKVRFFKDGIESNDLWGIVNNGYLIVGNAGVTDGSNKGRTDFDKNESEFGEYTVVVEDLTPLIDGRDFKPASASMKINVVNELNDFKYAYKNPFITKSKDVPVTVAAPVITHNGKKEPVNNFRIDYVIPGEYAKDVLKYVHVDKATGAVTIDKVFNIDEDISIGVLFDWERGYHKDDSPELQTSNELWLTISNKTLAEKIDWIALINSDEEFVDPKKLEVGKTYMLVAGDSNMTKPAFGAKTNGYFGDGVSIATNKNSIYDIAYNDISGFTEITVKKAGKASLKIVLSDGSVLPKDMATIAAASSYAKLDGAQLAYAYNNGKTMATIDAGKSVTISDPKTTGLVLRLEPTNGKLVKDMKLDVKVTNAKVLQKFDKESGTLRVIAKNAKKPITVKVKDKSVKNGKTFTYKIYNENKLTKKAKGIKQLAKSRIYSGVYKNTKQELKIQATKYKGKTLRLTPDYSAWSNKKTGVNYTKMANIFFTDDNGKIQELTADVDETGVATFKIRESSLDLPAGSYKFYITVMEDEYKEATAPTPITVKVTKAPANNKKISFTELVEMSTSTTSGKGERAHVKFTGDTADINSVDVIRLVNDNNFGSVNNFTSYFGIANEPDGFYIFVENDYLNLIDNGDLQGYVEVAYSVGKDVYGNPVETKTELFPITIVKTK